MIQVDDYAVHKLDSPPFYRVFDKTTFDREDPLEMVFRVQGILAAVNLPPLSR